jgi:hypothetical protein
LQSGFAYDRYNIGQAVYQPWWNYSGPRCLPSFSGDMRWEQDGQSVGNDSTNNELWRRGFDTILRPGPFLNVPVWNYRLSGTNDYGNKESGLQGGISTAVNDYHLRQAVPAIKAFLSESKLDRLYIWLKPTKDPQEKHIMALFDGVFNLLGITPAKTLKTNYYNLFKDQIDEILDELPSAYWEGIDPLVGRKLSVQLRDWGFRELDFLLSNGKISFAYFTGDPTGDAMLDMSEGFVTSRAQTLMTVLEISEQEAKRMVVEKYNTIPQFGNIGFLIDSNGNKAPNPIDGVDPDNYVDQINGIDTFHTPLAILKMVLAATVQPEAGASESVRNWVADTLSSASAFNGSWNQWAEFLAALPKFPA